MSDKYMLNICGGAISGNILNAISRLINTLLDFGRAIGSSIRRGITKNSC